MRLRAPLNEMIVTWPFGATSDDPRLAGVTHRGVDLRAAVGTPCRAAADGAAVALSQYDMGFGRYMRLGLGEVTLDGWDGSRLMGNVVVYYAHLIKRTPSQPVQRGAVIGWTGETGFCLGAHLHWEVRVDGVSVDPMLYVEGGPMEQLERVGEFAAAVRWQLEEAQREEEEADQLRGQADELERSARERRKTLISRVDGLAYATEIAAGRPAPEEWGEGL
jgi:hypothetical protein